MKIEMNNVHYTYKNNQENKVLRGLSYEFEVGKVYAICGPSGSGKTTILSLLAGLDEPQQGEIKFNNCNIKEQGYRKHRKDHVTLIFQNYNLIDYMTPLENIELVGKIKNKEILSNLGIEEKDYNRNILQLSGGQQQRVAIGRSLASKAPFILADEPTGNLDIENAKHIMGILKKSAHDDNKGVIIVTHSRNIARQADVTLYLNKNGLREL